MGLVLNRFLTLSNEAEKQQLSSRNSCIFWMPASSECWKKYFLSVMKDKLNSIKEMIEENNKNRRPSSKLLSCFCYLPESCCDFDFYIVHHNWRCYHSRIFSYWTLLKVQVGLFSYHYYDQHKRSLQRLLLLATEWYRRWRLCYHFPWWELWFWILAQYLLERWQFMVYFLKFSFLRNCKYKIHLVYF